MVVQELTGQEREVRPGEKSYKERRVQAEEQGAGHPSPHWWGLAPVVPIELTVSGHPTAPGDEGVRREGKSENHSPLLSFYLIMVSLSFFTCFSKNFRACLYSHINP